MNANPRSVLDETTTSSVEVQKLPPTPMAPKKRMKENGKERDISVTLPWPQKLRKEVLPVTAPQAPHKKSVSVKESCPHFAKSWSQFYLEKMDYKK